MYFALFLVSAAVTVWAAMRLSTYADTISQRSRIAGALIGAILLGAGTSLPEVTTSVSAIIIDNPDIAIGNVLGSNLFNLLILAILDLHFRREKIYEHAALQHRTSLLLGIGLMAIIMIALFLPFHYSIWHVGLDSILLIGAYAFGMVVLSKQQKKEAGAIPASNVHHKGGTEHLAQGEDIEPAANKSGLMGLPLPRIYTYFAIMAGIILIAGSALAISGDAIAVATGLTSSFVGSFMIAAATSLPELVACYAAFRLRNYNLAIGSVLASNVYNVLLISGTDVLYRPGAVLETVASIHLVTTSFAIFLSGIVLYSLLRRKTGNTFAYVLPSLCLIVIYFISSYMIFTGL